MSIIKMIFHRVFPIFIVTIFLFACSESEINQSEEAGIDQLVTLGEAVYTVKELGSAALNEREADEGCFIYHADNRYLVYGITNMNDSDTYLLTSSLHVYDYKKGIVVRSISFDEPGYVGDAVLNRDSLFYSRIPINLITTISAVWEVHEADSGRDVVRIKGISSFPDNYPRFGILNEKVIFSYEDKEDGSDLKFGCKLIDRDYITSLFYQTKNDDVNSKTSFLNTQIKSNGKTAFFFIYENGKLYYSFLDETGITDKLLFEGEMYHSGMINDGLIISKALEQDQSGAFSQISITSNTGEEDTYLDRNSGSYFRFTSGPENHSMAIDSFFNLHLFQYEKSSMKRTKIVIDPDVDAQGTEPFYVGDNNYLVTSTFRDDSVKLHLIHIEN